MKSNPISAAQMAPNGEMLVANSYSKSNFEGLQRAISDLSFQISKEAAAAAVAASADASKLPPIAEVEDAKCECCGMSEECTQGYIRHVRDKFAGRLVCGLCAEAVKEEAAKNGGRQREAVEAHMGMCRRFNRTHPVQLQVEAMREILRKAARGGRASRGGEAKKECLTRSSSCIPAITKEMNNNYVLQLQEEH
ncbi:uncharacterized protein LOC141825895 [Curcuma longa]|uniref:uncharacterized protein LOC141825895 n=1 Tax=Curcuma longa TaxID=136217 RepID=UPI003D9DBB05